MESVKQKRNPRVRRMTALRRKYRMICAKVLDAYLDVKSTVGQAPAVNYTKITGGGRAMFKGSDNGNAFIDFVVDVESAAKYALGESRQKKHFKEVLGKDGLNLTVQSVEFMNDEATLGRIFLARGLYPVSMYFKGVRERAK
jgi:hypothetical protein